MRAADLFEPPLDERAPGMPVVLARRVEALARRSPRGIDLRCERSHFLDRLPITPIDLAGLSLQSPRFPRMAPERSRGLA
jgi:hypothetical protein